MGWVLSMCTIKKPSRLTAIRLTFPFYKDWVYTWQSIPQACGRPRSKLMHRLGHNMVNPRTCDVKAETLESGLRVHRLVFTETCPRLALSPSRKLYHRACQMTTFLTDWLPQLKARWLSMPSQLLPSLSSSHPCREEKLPAWSYNKLSKRQPSVLQSWRMQYLTPDQMHVEGFNQRGREKVRGKYPGLHLDWTWIQNPGFRR